MHMCTPIHTYVHKESVYKCIYPYTSLALHTQTYIYTGGDGYDVSSSARLGSASFALFCRFGGKGKGIGTPALSKWNKNMRRPVHPKRQKFSRKLRSVMRPLRKSSYKRSASSSSAESVGGSVDVRKD